MEVETKHADLATMAVTINALHVNGKRMTLSVFRQLPQGEEVDGDPLWGIVRYSIKDEGDIWLVFSHGGILYRRELRFHTHWRDSGEIDSHKWDMEFHKDRASKIAECANRIEKARVNTTTPASFFNGLFEREWVNDNYDQIRDVLESSKRPILVNYGIGTPPTEPWNIEDRDRRPDELTEEEARFIERLRNATRVIEGWSIEAKAKYNQRAQQESDRLEREKRLLDELPQLFIAV